MGHRHAHSGSSDGSPPPEVGAREEIDGLIGNGLEGVVLLLTGLAPWAFGATEPVFEFLLDAGVALVLLLWSLRAVVRGRWYVAAGPFAFCLAGLFLLGVWQITPLPQGWLGKLSPAAAKVYEQLLPAEPEILSDEQAELPHTLAAGSTLSLYPGVTRRETVRIFVILLFFLAVRSNCSSTAGLRRLSCLAVVNGACLSFFGIAQHFATPDWHWIYGSATVQGMAFGPFVYRNYYACYTNLCIGLAIGLLASRVMGGDEPSQHRRHSRSVRGSSVEAYDQPRLVKFVSENWWIGGSLVLMLSSLLVCQSRGGVLAPLGAAAVLLIPLRKTLRWEYLLSAAALAACMAGLLVWLGFSWSESRLQTIPDGRILEDSRFDIWARDVTLLKDFPVWGAGYGTFPYLDQPRQIRAGYHVVDYAHNDYLEGWIEGGVIRLLLSLVAVGYVFWCGWRAATHSPSRECRGLAVGALFAWTGLALHCLGDFMLHAPAVVILATVLAAQLSGMGASLVPSSQRAQYEEEAPRQVISIRLAGIAPVASLLIAVAVGLVITTEGWAAYRAQRWLLETLPLPPDEDTVPAADKIACLRAATCAQPHSARLHVLLGQAYEDLFDEEWAADERRRELLRGLLAVQLPAGGFAAQGSVPRFLVNALGVLPAIAREDAERKATYNRLVQPCLVPALRSYVRARDLCPLIAKPHVRIAAHHELFRRAEPRGAYLDRASRLVPYDANLAYLVGIQAERERQLDDACRYWRRSLELSDDYLGVVLAHGRKHFQDGALLDRLLPDRPAVIYAAAMMMREQDPETMVLRPFFTKALRLLDAGGGPESGDDWQLKADLCRGLGLPSEARAAYEAALRHEPTNNPLRLDYAHFLFDQAKYAEARTEAVKVVSRDAKDAKAQEFLTAVDNAARAAEVAAKLFDHTSHNFGGAPRGTLLTHTFRLKNPHPFSLRLTALRASSDGAWATVTNSAVRPGETTDVEVTIDTAKYSGPRSITVSVPFENMTLKEAELRLWADSREDVSVEPAELTLGRERGAKARATVAYRGSRDDWQLSGVDADPNLLKAGLKEVERAAGKVVYELNVEAVKAAGARTTQVWLKTNDPTGPQLPVAVTVGGPARLTAHPSKIDLGHVRAGNPITGRVVIRGPQPFRIREVQGGSMFWRVNAGGGESKNVHIVEVTFHADPRIENLSRRFKVLTDLPRDGSVEFTAEARAAAFNDRSPDSDSKSEIRKPRTSP